MPIPFGFSIGDFITVGTLAIKIIGIINNQGAVTADLRRLVETLWSFENICKRAYRIGEKWQQHRRVRRPGDDPTCNGLVHEVKICKELLEEVYELLDTYTQSMLRKMPKTLGRRYQDLK